MRQDGFAGRMKAQSVDAIPYHGLTVAFHSALADFVEHRQEFLINDRATIIKNFVSLDVPLCNQQ